MRRSRHGAVLVRWMRALVALLGLLVAEEAAAQGLGDFISPGELAASHAELSGVTQCTACHELGGGVSADACMSCHDHVARQVSTGTGFHADKGQRCGACHPDHRGRDAALVEVHEAAFDHAATGFPLRGAHGALGCEACHREDGRFVGLEPACAACHDDPHGAVEARPFVRQCAGCHGEVDWEVLSIARGVFDHDDPLQADFPLHGRHVEVPCAGCHDDLRFVPVPSARCEDCHEDLHRGQFAPRTCDACHTVQVADFALRGWDHAARTEWPLEGGHRGVACERCHGDGARARYVDLPHERCDTCHDDPHEGQFAPRDCAACHSVRSFAEGGLDHDATGFPLRRAHADVACDACHGDGPAGRFAGLPFDDCDSCHVDAHEGRFEPAACFTCHDDGSWSVDDLDHDLTRYPLTGAHREVGCVACHGEGEARVLTPLPFASCMDCHRDDEPHRGAMAAERCDSCHETDAWAVIAFDHLAETGFPLVGHHQPLGCAACHADPTFALEGSRCEVCHAEDEPADHFDGACADCHLPTGWQDATLGLEEHARTGFPLRGAHSRLACLDCHADESVGRFCVDCHATDDPHRHLLGDQCDTCHTTSDWIFTRFTHAATGFPLRGAHRLAACADCHATGYAGTPTTCRRCHERERPRDALHADPLTAECDACHRPYSWEGARYPHGGSR